MRSEDLKNLEKRMKKYRKDLKELRENMRKTLIKKEAEKTRRKFKEAQEKDK